MPPRKGSRLSAWYWKNAQPLLLQAQATATSAGECARDCSQHHCLHYSYSTRKVHHPSSTCSLFCYQRPESERFFISDRLTGHVPMPNTTRLNSNEVDGWALNGSGWRATPYPLQVILAQA